MDSQAPRCTLRGVNADRSESQEQTGAHEAEKGKEEDKTEEEWLIVRRGLVSEDVHRDFETEKQAHEVEEGGVRGSGQRRSGAAIRLLGEACVPPDQVEHDLNEELEQYE